MLTPGLGSSILVVDRLHAARTVHGSTVGSPSTAAPDGSWHGAKPGRGLEPHPEQLLSEHPKFWKARIDLGS